MDLDVGTIPNVSGALNDWFQKLTFSVVTKAVVNSVVTETLTTTVSKGVWQPFSPQQLLLKPEGQRAWKWFTVHALPSLILSPDDVFVFKTVRYRVMQKLDWKEYGYVEYHIIQDYT